MKNKSAKQTLKEYRLKLAGVALGYIAILALLTLVVMPLSVILGMLGIVVLGLSVRKPIESISIWDIPVGSDG